MIVAAISTPTQENPQSGSLFDAIAGRAQQTSEEYRLVTQPDHAKLSGAVAAAFDRKRLPHLTDEIVEGIGAHDAGWLAIDGAGPKPILPPYDGSGRLRSFLTTSPPIFLQAWTGSIAYAERIGPTAGAMVSQHFERLAHFRLQREQDIHSDVLLLQGFIAKEYARQMRLQTLGVESTDESLKLLQLCDLVSLYLCCGLESAQDLGIDLGFGPVRIERNSESNCVLSGVPLQGIVRYECPVFRWSPGSPTLRPEMLAVHIQPN